MAKKKPSEKPSELNSLDEQLSKKLENNDLNFEESLPVSDTFIELEVSQEIDADPSPASFIPSPTDGSEIDEDDIVFNEPGKGSKKPASTPDNAEKKEKTVSFSTPPPPSPADVVDGSFSLDSEEDIVFGDGKTNSGSSSSSDSGSVNLDAMMLETNEGLANWLVSMYDQHLLNFFRNKALISEADINHRLLIEQIEKKLSKQIMSAIESANAQTLEQTELTRDQKNTLRDAIIAVLKNNPQLAENLSPEVQLGVTVLLQTVNTWQISRQMEARNKELVAEIASMIKSAPKMEI